MVRNRYENKLRLMDASSHPVLQRKLMRYFTEIPVLTQKGTKTLAKALRDLSKNSAVIIFYSDPNSPSHYLHNKWFHEYIGKITKERQFLPVMITDKTLLKDYGLEGAESGSLHLIKRHSNKYDLHPADAEVAGVKCHILKDIDPFTNEGDLSLAEIMGKLSVFSEAMPEKYQVTVTVDRNSIPKGTSDNIAKIFKEIKLSNKFPEVSFKLANAPVKHGNKQFEILATDFFSRANDEDDPTLEGRERIKTRTYEYLFDGILSQHTVEHFISQVTSNKWPEHFKSQPDSPKYILDKVTAQNFNNKVLLDEKDHLVFEYSDDCHVCEQLMPVIADFTAHNKNRNFEE